MTKTKDEKPKLAIEQFGWTVGAVGNSTGFPVTGPQGEIRVEKPIARMLVHMHDGQLYPFKKLAEVAGYATPSMAETAMHAMRPRLAQIGINVIIMRELVRVFVER